MYDDTNVYESKLAVQSLQHNCGITEIILEGNTVDEDLKLQFDEELEKNQGIVETIFPVIKERELLFLRKRVEHMRR